MQKGLRCAIRWTGMLIGLICLYTIALLVVYSFPDEWVKPNVEAGLNVIREESNMPGGYATYFWHNGFGITDNITDKTIYKGMLRNERSITDAAMRTDYARYWHGYAVLLRPMLTVLSIINIRYLNMMLIMGLLGLCYWHCRRRLGAWTAGAFGVGLLMTFILIAPFCQQYIPATLLTLAACYVLLRFWEKLRSRLMELFLLIGSLMCFFDFLTFPVLALGYPLLVCLLLEVKGGQSARKLWADLFGLSAIWMLSYALTWLSKALVGGMLTDVNVLNDILDQVTKRTGVDPAEGYTIEEALTSNLEAFFMGSNAAFFAGMLALIGIRAVKNPQPAREWLRALPVAVTALYPFIWFCVMKNHVRVHFWMTNKMLAITVFALCAYGVCITRQGLEEKTPTPSPHR